MKPSDLYQQHVTRPDFDEDPAQHKAMDFFDRLHDDLAHKIKQENSPGFHIRNLLGTTPTPVTGLYLWGGVGRGKTWMMDLFFDALPYPEKIRLHFHHFMRAVHDQLSLLKGHRNPLRLIARNFAKKYRLLCLDEFHVSDITDAMLLYGLLDALFQQGVSLVATSNLAPDELYKNGLQRERFIPAIELIKKHTKIVNIDNGVDHRLRLLEKADTWYPSTTTDSHARLQQRFEQLAPCRGEEKVILRINYRNIETLLLADDVAWFSFDSLCNGPRATDDYIEIARRFHTLFISDIPVMDESTDDLAQRFVNMIDEFYDRNLKLVISAAAGPSELYRGTQLAFDFQRTASRLEEMRSHEYLQRPHKP
jgi:cell division protein ZapE